MIPGRCPANPNPSAQTQERPPLSPRYQRVTPRRSATLYPSCLPLARHCSWFVFAGVSVSARRFWTPVQLADGALSMNWWSLTRRPSVPTMATWVPIESGSPPLAGSISHL